MPQTYTEEKQQLNSHSYQSKSKRMQKMLEVLKYLLARLDQPVTAEETATAFGYNKKYFEGIFTEYFEMPFHKFLKKLRLRRAAEALIRNRTVKNEWSLYGFESNVSFSGAFKKEFGCSPRNFLEADCKIPAMPDKKRLFGVPIQIQYGGVGELALCGYPLEPEHKDQTDLLEEAAYALDHPDPCVDLECLPEWFGIWWFDYERDNHLYYLTAAREEYAEHFRECRMETVTIPPDYYAVFSFKRMPSSGENACMARLLARYALLEWKLLTYKKPNNMGWTFERFDRERIWLYVPIINKEDGEGLLPYKGSGVDTWPQYIDRHITEKLTLSSLAEMAHYTPKSFRDIFTLYYAIDPIEYVKKRRLYEAASELSGQLLPPKTGQSGGENAREGRRQSQNAGTKRPEKIAAKYRFSSYEVFRQQFREEFQTEPEQYPAARFETVDLHQFYHQNRDRLKIRLSVEEDLYFIGKPLKQASSLQEDQDIAELASFWFKENYPDLPQICKEPPRVKAALWCERRDAKTGETLYEYVLGPVLESQTEPLPEELGSYTFCSAEGGRYMIFETLDESDLVQTAAVYRMLTRCAFFGWIRENLYRYDGNRLTYVKYESEKLHFYVPVKG